MKERIKTFALVFLVLTSFYLSYTLWTSFPQKSAFMTKSTLSSVDLFNLIRPSSIIIDSGGTYKYITSKDDTTTIWTNVVKLIKENLESGNRIDLNDAKYTNTSQNAIHIIMGGGISKDIFVNALHIDDESSLKRIDSDTYIKEIIITIGKNAGLIFTDHNKYFRIALKDPQYFKGLIDKEFKNSIDYKKSTAGDVYYPDMSATKHLIIKKYINKDVTYYNLYRSITEKIFVNISIVREIRENNGAYIYTDGIKGLRIYKNNRIEYYDTTLSKLDLDRLESLNKALSFIKDVGVRLDRIYLAEMKENGPEYNFSFNYLGDYPAYLVKDGKEIQPINITILNGTIKSATVNYIDMYYAGNYQIAAYDPNKAINLHKISDVRSIRLIYIFDDATLTPAWEVRCKDKDYFINAIEGKLIS